MQETYAVMDTDRNTIITAGSTINADHDGMSMIIAQEGQNTFNTKATATKFLEEHQDEDGFGPELTVVNLTPVDE